MITSQSSFLKISTHIFTVVMFNAALGGALVSCVQSHSPAKVTPVGNPVPNPGTNSGENTGPQGDPAGKPPVGDGNDIEGNGNPVGSPASPSASYTLTGVQKSVSVGRAKQIAKLEIVKKTGVSVLSSKTVTGKCKFDASESGTASGNSGIYTITATAASAGSCTGEFELVVPTQMLKEKFTLTVDFSGVDVTTGIPPVPNGTTVKVEITACVVGAMPISTGRTYYCNVDFTGSGQYKITVPSSNCTFRSDGYFDASYPLSLNGSYAKRLYCSVLQGTTTDIELNVLQDSNVVGIGKYRLTY